MGRKCFFSLLPKSGINSELVSSQRVNADEAKCVGEKIKSSAKINDDQVQVDPTLLFQRLIMACENSQLAEFFRYELCTYPTSLFDSPLTVRQPQKPPLAEALWANLSPEAKTQFEGMSNMCWMEVPFSTDVLWPRGSPTYKE